MYGIAESFGGSFWLIAAAALLLVAIVLFYFLASLFSLWLQALFSKAEVGIFQLLGMRLRKVNPRIIVEARIMSVKAGIPVETNLLEVHYLSRSDKKEKVLEVVAAVVAANKANIPLSFAESAAIDLAGRDVLDAVKTSVKPKVITTPKISAVALDGIQLQAVTRITVRTNIRKLVGGAGEETVIARVGEGIVSSIGSAKTHKAVLENPNMISKKVLASGLDAGTAYEILSIDIADVDVGHNIGAILEADRAETDKKIAQAKAEERRAMAAAAEQEMKARVVEMQAKVVEAEAQVPLAMADALKNGKLGVMDYYNLQNIKADTQMRAQISGVSEKDLDRK
ncbi:MAG: flotillin-like protein FloA [Fibromonadales bacterium]|nr:flotillin-like protein FloA [Fibromonadales bacterium]